MLDLSTKLISNTRNDRASAGEFFIELTFTYESTPDGLIWIRGPPSYVSPPFTSATAWTIAPGVL